MRLGILFGGASYEHEISIVSAYQLKKRIEEKYEIHMIYISTDQEVFLADKLKISDFKYEHNRKLKKIHFKSGGLSKIRLDAMVGCMHGENGEDGIAAALCRFFDIPYLGCDLLSSSVAIHKYRSYQLLSKNGIPMLQTICYTYSDYLQNKAIPFMPCIMKPACGGSSIGIVVCHHEEELSTKLVEAFSHGNEIIIQPFMTDVHEYNLALNEHDYSNLESIHKKDDIFSFSNKYTDSFKQMHQSLIEDQRFQEFCSIARQVYELLGCSGIIRIDFFLIEDTIYVNEVNTTPGALAMYLFPDFDLIFEKSLNHAIHRKRPKYPKGSFLMKSDIRK